MGPYDLDFKMNLHIIFALEGPNLVLNLDNIATNIRLRGALFVEIFTHNMGVRGPRFGDSYN